MKNPHPISRVGAFAVPWTPRERRPPEGSGTGLGRPMYHERARMSSPPGQKVPQRRGSRLAKPPRSGSALTPGATMGRPAAGLHAPCSSLG